MRHEIVGQEILKIDIPGFGSCMYKELSPPITAKDFVDTLQSCGFANWGFTYSNATSTSTEETKVIVVPSEKVPEVLRCGCGAEGQYWGMRLAFPLPLCFTCLKREHKKEALPKVGLWRRVWRFFFRGKKC